MTTAHLARIAESIAADERTTEVSNWPLSRERTRLYLALARAVEPWLADWDYDSEWYSPESRAIAAAFAALAPETPDDDEAYQDWLTLPEP